MSCCNNSHATDKTGLRTLGCGEVVSTSSTSGGWLDPPVGPFPLIEPAASEASSRVEITSGVAGLDQRGEVVSTSSTSGVSTRPARGALSAD